MPVNATASSESLLWSAQQTWHGLARKAVCISPPVAVGVRDNLAWLHCRVLVHHLWLHRTGSLFDDEARICGSSHMRACKGGATIKFISTTPYHALLNTPRFLF